MDHKTRYINEREVSKNTGRALPTLRNDRFNRRGITFCKIGRSVRYKLDDVYEFMESRRIETEGL